MSRYLVVKNPPVHLWNSFLETYPEGNFEQCFEYGEITKLAFQKSRVIRFATTYKGEPLGIVQGNYSSYLGFGMKLGVMRGPLVKIKNKEASRLVENLLKSLEDYAKKNRIIQAKILVPEAWSIQEVFHALGYTPTFFMNEYVVSLEKSEDELWKNISHNKRRNIKKATDKGVEIVQSHEYKDLLTFYSMLEASEERGGFSSYPLSWFEAAWKICRPELSDVFLARWKGKDVSGVFTVVHGRTVYALAAGSFKEGWEARPNDKMHWDIMKWACQKGYSRYHMGLVEEPPPTKGSEAWGIWRWKREWNGSLKRIQVFNKLLLPRYKLVLKAKETVERAYTTYFRQLARARARKQLTSSKLKS